MPTASMREANPAVDNATHQNAPDAAPSGPQSTSDLAAWLTQNAAASEAQDSAAATQDQTQAEAPAADAAPAPEAASTQEGDQVAQEEAEPSLLEEEEQHEEQHEEGEPDASGNGAQRKINKLRAKLGDAERTIAELRNKIAEGQTETRAPMSTAGLAPLNSYEAKLVARQAQLKGALTLIRRNPDGLTIGEQSWTADELPEEADNARNELAAVTVELNQLRQRIGAQSTHLRATAVKVHPWLADPEHPDSRAIRQAFEEWPVLERIPGMVEVLASALSFHKAPPKPNGRPKAPSPPPRAPRAVAPTQDRRAAIEAAVKDVNETGSRRALADYMKATQ